MQRLKLPVVDDAERWVGELDLEQAQVKLDGLLKGLAQVMPEGMIVALSGGVDSAFLVWVAEVTRREVGGRLIALTTVSESVPQWDVSAAVDFAKLLGVEHTLVPTNEMTNPEYTRNGADRCYHCKAELFHVARKLALRHSVRWVAYGYTASDLGDVRPGHRAALENGVLSPLLEAAITKAEIRALMHVHGLPLFDKPASPCLSSRIMTGLPIEPSRLRDVEVLEALLHAAGVRECRVRVCGEGAGMFLRVEVGVTEMPKVLAVRESLTREGKVRGYRWVTLDLDGYRPGGGWR